jgi:chaperone modulatory protein CbpM
MSGSATITIETLCVRFSTLRREDLHRWIGNAWVRPESDSGDYLFQEIDIERVRLILQLRDEMQVNEDALPVVLSLLDQLYDMRRRMRRLRDALDQTVTEDIRMDLRQRLGDMGA